MTTVTLPTISDEERWVCLNTCVLRHSPNVINGAFWLLMHELSIAQAILDRVANEMQRHPGTRPVEVGVLIGEISGVDRDALAFGFEALVNDSDWARLALNIECRSRRHRCPACSREFDVSSFETACPECGNLATLMLAGDELDIAYIEVEDI